MLKILQESIQNSRSITFTYESSFEIVYPYAIGIKEDGAQVLVAVSAGQEKIRLFKLTKIKLLKQTLSIFKQRDYWGFDLPEEVNLIFEKANCGPMVI